MTDKPKEVPNWAEKHNLDPGHNEEATKAIREFTADPNNQGTIYNPGRSPRLKGEDPPPGMEQVYTPK